MQIQDIFYVQIVFLILTFIMLYKLLKTDSRVEKKLEELMDKLKNKTDRI